MKWWETVDIVNSFANSVKAQADKAMNAYTNKYKELITKQAQSEAEYKAQQQARFKAACARKKAANAEERIMRANEEFQRLGIVQDGMIMQIPLTQDNINREMSGNYANYMLQQAVINAGQMRDADLWEAAKHDSKNIYELSGEATVPWAQLPYLDQQEFIQQVYQGLIAKRYPQGKFNIQDPNSFTFPQTYEQLADTGIQYPTAPITQMSPEEYSGNYTPVLTQLADKSGWQIQQDLVPLVHEWNQNSWQKGEGMLTVLGYLNHAVDLDPATKTAIYEKYKASGGINEIQTPRLSEWVIGDDGISQVNWTITPDDIGLGGAGNRARDVELVIRGDADGVMNVYHNGRRIGTVVDGNLKLDDEGYLYTAAVPSAMDRAYLAGQFQFPAEGMATAAGQFFARTSQTFWSEIQKPLILPNGTNLGVSAATILEWEGRIGAAAALIWSGVNWYTQGQRWAQTESTHRANFSNSAFGNMWEQAVGYGTPEYEYMYMVYRYAQDAATQDIAFKLFQQGIQMSPNMRDLAMAWWRATQGAGATSTATAMLPSVPADVASAMSQTGVYLLPKVTGFPTATQALGINTMAAAISIETVSQKIMAGVELTLPEQQFRANNSVAVEQYLQSRIGVPRTEPPTATGKVTAPVKPVKPTPPATVQAKPVTPAKQPVTGQVFSYPYTQYNKKLGEAFIANYKDLTTAQKTLLRKLYESTWKVQVLEKHGGLTPDLIKILQTKSWEEFSRARGYSPSSMKIFQQNLDLVEAGKKLGIPEDVMIALTAEVNQTLAQAYPEIAERISQLPAVPPAKVTTAKAKAAPAVKPAVSKPTIIKKQPLTSSQATPRKEVPVEQAAELTKKVVAQEQAATARAEDILKSRQPEIGKVTPTQKPAAKPSVPRELEAIEAKETDARLRMANVHGRLSKAKAQLSPDADKVKELQRMYEAAELEWLNAKELLEASQGELGGTFTGQPIEGTQAMGEWITTTGEPVVPTGVDELSTLHIELRRAEEALERTKTWYPSETGEIASQEAKIADLKERIAQYPETTAGEEWSTYNLAEGTTGSDPIIEGMAEGADGYAELQKLRYMRGRYVNKRIQYEEAKRQLIDYVKKNMPKEIQGKMLTDIKNVGTELELERAIAKADAYTEKYVEKVLLNKIMHELETIDPKRVAGTGMRYGKFDADTQKLLWKIRDNIKMDRDDARAKMGRVMEAMENGTVNWADAQAELEALQYSGIGGMDSDELARTLNIIKTIKTTGRSIKAAQRAAEMERIQKDHIAIDNTISGGHGLKTGEVNPRNLWKRDNPIKNFVTNQQYGLDDIADSLSVFDKESKPYQSPLSQQVFKIHMASSTRSKGIIEWLDNKTAAAFEEIYGVTKGGAVNELVHKLISDKIEIGEFVNLDGKTIKFEMTKDQMIQKYLELKDPTLQATFTEGMKWSNEMITALKGSLSAQDIRFADWLAMQYQVYGETIAQVFEAKYGIPMPRNPFYVPINRDLEAIYYEHIMMAMDNYRLAGVTNQSLKARTKSKIPLRFNGALQTWARHVIQMEHFKAFAEPMKEMRIIFQNANTRELVRQYHGNDRLTHLDRHLDDIARDGINQALIIQGLDKLRGHFTLAALGIKPMVAVKQVLSLPAYMFYEPMPIGDFFTGVADFWKHPVASFKEMKELSGYFQERWGRGHERDIRIAKMKDVAGRLSGKKNWRDAMMLPIHGMDTLATMQGSWAVYQSMLKQVNPATGQLYTKQEAITHAEIATKRTQPAFGVESEPALRKHGSIGKALTMFQSQPSQYYRAIAGSLRNLRAGRGSKARNILKFVMAWWILPSLFQLLSDAGRWDKEHQARVAVLGAGNYILVAGQMLQALWGRATGEPFQSEISPVYTTVRELEEAISRIRSIYNQGQDPIGDVDSDTVVKLLENIATIAGQVGGVPTPYVIQVERMIRNADLRQLLWSEYALGSSNTNERVIDDLKDLYADAYGVDNFNDLPQGDQGDIGGGSQSGFYNLNEGLKIP